MTVKFMMLKTGMELAAAIVAFLFSGCTLVMGRSRLYRREVYAQFFVGFLFCGFFLLGDAVRWIVAGESGEGAKLLLSFGHYLSAACLTLMFLWVSMNTVRIGKNSKTSKLLLGGLHLCSLSALILLLLVNPFTGVIFYASESNAIVHGRLYALYAVLTGLPAIISTITLILYRKEFPSVGWFSMMFYVAFPTAMWVISIFFPSMPLLQLAIAAAQVVAFNAIVFFESKRGKERQREVEEQRRRLLLAQLQPHFVANALLSISGIEGNPPQTVEAINHFSRYLRDNIAALEQEGTIRISEELRHVREYLELEKLRFEDKLSYDIRAGEEDFRLPPLAVQTLVENAVRHGLIHGTGGGTVSICSGETETGYYVTVTDDGIGFDAKESFSEGNRHHGLRITQERLQLMCGGQLEIESTPGAGTRATIYIPREANEA